MDECGGNKNKNWPLNSSENRFKCLGFSYFIKIKYKKQTSNPNESKNDHQNYTFYKKNLDLNWAFKFFLCFFCWYLRFSLLWSNCHVNSIYGFTYALFFQKCCEILCIFLKMIEHTIILLNFLNWDATIVFIISICLFGWLVGCYHRSTREIDWK